MDVANGSAAATAEAHLRRLITRGGQSMSGLLDADSLSHITFFPHGHLEDMHLSEFICLSLS